MNLLAIDPGLKGGLATFSGGRLVSVDRMPVWKPPVRRGNMIKKQVNVLALIKIVQQHDIEAIVTEYQTAMSGQSSVATATSFLNYGLVLSLRSLCALHIVHPRVWKRHFDLGPHKAAAIYHARLVYPTLDVRVPDGVAEAVLIGRYWLEAGAEKERLWAARPLPKRRRRKAKPPSASLRRRGSGASSGTGPA